jgi:hypothetical protein
MLITIPKMKNLFERRLEMRIDAENPVVLQGLLDMYANPVVNQLKHKMSLKLKYHYCILVEPLG